MTRYKIRITKIETVAKTISEYQRIADTGNETDGKTKYGYVPTTAERDEETDLLSAEVEDLFLEGVIKAIYKL